MFTGDFLKDAEVSIQTILSRERKTVGGVFLIGIILLLTFLFMPVFLLLDLAIFIVRAFGL